MIIEDWDKLKQTLESEKSKGKIIVFTNGCFDIIHPGHVDYLTKSKNLGDFLVVALNRDSSVRKLKGESRPINSEDDRAIVMNALKPVDFVTFFEEDTPLNIITHLTPNTITKGGDYKKEDVVGGDHVIKNGGNVEIIPFIEGKSTTKIIEKMMKPLS
jgi:D-beta-D-heptose 7-phosphate kinase/D-beta-D-heptose 1-phosphate adenosyltransferase